MFLALIGNAELLLLGLTAALVCGVAIGWVARDCARLRRASEAPARIEFLDRPIHDSFGRFCRCSGPQLARGGNEREPYQAAQTSRLLAERA